MNSGSDRKPVKLSELLEPVELDAEIFDYWVDLQTGSVLLLPVDLMVAVEDNDEEDAEELSDWDKEEIGLAKSILEDEEGRFIKAPTKFDFHEYRHMERFIATVEDDGAADQLWQAIRGKGAFRYFRDTVSRLGMLKEWYEYRDKAMREFVLEWAEGQGISVVDDRARNSQ